MSLKTPERQLHDYLAEVSERTELGRAVRYHRTGFAQKVRNAEYRGNDVGAGFSRRGRPQDAFSRSRTAFGATG